MIWQAPGTLAPEQRRAFDDLLSYCVPEPAAARVEHSGEFTEVCFPEADGWPPDRVAGLLTAAWERAAATAPARPRVLFESQTEVASNPGGNGLQPVGPGLNVAGPAVARLMRGLDRRFLELALDAGAAEHAVPHLTAWETIERAGYAGTFPQHLTVCSVVGPDLAALDRFAAARRRADRHAETVPAGVVLAPTVCLNLFAGLADTVVPGPWLATATGGCARHEAGSERSATRLWAFTMREVVFVGEAGAAKRFRDAMLDAVRGVAEEAGLPCRLLSANDPFFTKDRADAAAFQSSFHLKYELLAEMGDGTAPTAVSSVNLHSQHFGVGFGIGLPDGTPAHSACVGFGLERWAQWILSHLGPDPADWPPSLRP